MSEPEERRAEQRGWYLLAPLLPLIAVAVALWQAPVPAPLPDLTEEQAEQVARTLRRQEPTLRVRAAHKFTADPWSQSDHFAHTEATMVRRQSERLGVRPGAVLRAIDTDVRTHPELPGRPPGERGYVPPCMPRVFYH